MTTRAPGPGYWYVVTSFIGVRTLTTRRQQSYANVVRSNSGLTHARSRWSLSYTSVVDFPSGWVTRTRSPAASTRNAVARPAESVKRASRPPSYANRVRRPNGSWTYRTGPQQSSRWTCHSAPAGFRSRYSGYRGQPVAPPAAAPDDPASADTSTHWRYRPVHPNPYSVGSVDRLL